MYHAAPGDLQPFLAHLARKRARKINLEARLGVAEVVRTETNLHVAAEQFLEDKLDGALEVADGDAFVHVKAFDLLEGRIVRGVSVVATIDPARHDDADGGLLFLHHADLDARSMSAEKKRFTLIPSPSPIGWERVAGRPDEG